LKLGQILSIQDTNVVSPQLIKAFDRVRQAADYMPDWQVERVMVKQLGSDWRLKFAKFEEKPFAAGKVLIGFETFELSQHFFLNSF
jgi:aarF domain-containing kinase